MIESVTNAPVLYIFDSKCVSVLCVLECESSASACGDFVYWSRVIDMIVFVVRWMMVSLTYSDC